MEEQNIDHNVLNTLYLMSEDLGKAYEREGFNPFQEGYQINTAQVDGILLNNENNEPIPSPEFLEGSKRSTLKHFALSEKNTDKLGDLLKAEEKEVSGNRMNLEDVYLRCRKKMLQLAQNEIKNGGMSPLEAYEKMYRLNRSYAKVMEKTYVESELDLMKLREELAMSTVLQENIVRDPKAKVLSQKVPAKEQTGSRATAAPEIIPVQKESVKTIPTAAPKIKQVASENLREQITKEEVQKQKEEEIRKREEQLRQLNTNKKTKLVGAKPETLSDDKLKNFYIQQVQAQKADAMQMQKLVETERAKPAEPKQKEDTAPENSDKKDRDH